MLFDYYLEYYFHSINLYSKKEYYIDIDDEIIDELKYKSENMSAMIDYKYTAYKIFNNYLRIKNNFGFNFEDHFSQDVETESIMKKYIGLIDKTIKNDKHMKKEIIFRGYNTKMNEIFNIHYKNNMPYHEKGFLSTSTESFVAINFSYMHSGKLDHSDTITGPILIMDYDPKEIRGFSFDKLEKNIPYLNEYEIILERDIFIHMLREIKPNVYICAVNKSPVPLEQSDKIKLEKKIMKRYNKKMEHYTDLNNFDIKKIIKLYYLFVILDILKIGPYNDISRFKTFSKSPKRYFKRKLLKKYNLIMSKAQEKDIAEKISKELDLRNNFYNEELLIYMISDLYRNNFFTNINFDFKFEDACNIFGIKDLENKLKCKSRKNSKLKNIFTDLKYMMKKNKLKRKNNDIVKMFSFIN